MVHDVWDLRKILAVLPICSIRRVYEERILLFRTYDVYLTEMITQAVFEIHTPPAACLLWPECGSEVCSPS
jgi:hypothetical protein